MENLKNSETFFKYYLNKKNSLIPENFEKFSYLKTDTERFGFVHQSNNVTKLNPIEKKFTGKDYKTSLIEKKQGNIEFLNKNWLKAAQHYTKSYISIPSDIYESDTAIIVANRSAATYHLKCYNDSLIDIERSLKLNYPKELHYKLYERKASCYLAQKNYPDAIEAFKKTIIMLDYAKLTDEKKNKLEKNSAIMIKMLERDTTNISKKSKNKEEKIKFFISDSLKFEYNDIEGYFAKSKKSIDVGEKILIEKPYSFSLLPDYCLEHCQNCFIRSLTSIPCPNCANVVFCSDICQEEALKSYHKYECGLLEGIWDSKISINCHIAYRIIASKSLSYFKSKKGNFTETLSPAESLKLDKADYSRVAHLVQHNDKRTISANFQYAIMADFLSNCLEKTEFYGESPNIDDINLIGGLLITNLKFLQFNTHEIYELHESPNGKVHKTVFIGGGIYPTFARFNHSCDPATTKYFIGNIAHVHAIRPIDADTAITENYGPLYSQQSRKERKEILKELYWFDCNCIACKEDWPRFDEMDNTVIRLRCDSKKVYCNNILEIPASCNDFMVKCMKCHEFTNIFKGLKAMQDVEAMRKTAENIYYESKNKHKALKKFIDILKIMHAVLAPPFTDYCLCQQKIKDCLVYFGNRFTSMALK